MLGCGVVVLGIKLTVKHTFKRKINLIKNILIFEKILKNKLLNLDKYFYHPNRSYNEIHKLAIIYSKKIKLNLKFFIFSIKNKK